MKIESITNDKFPIFTVDGKPTQVRALPMTDAVAWAALATDARRAVDVAVDYGQMRDALTQCREVLAQYPDVDAAVLERCSLEQVTGAIDALLEVNDPFARRRRRAEAEAERKQARELELLKAMPPETVKLILEQNSDALSAALPNASG